MSETSTTPTATKVVLVLVLATTVAALGAVAWRGAQSTLTTRDVGVALSVLTALFALRVAGQILVVLRAPQWLPPATDWNLVPYRWLLPAQVVILGALVVVCGVFLTAGGAAVERDGAGRDLLVALAAAYAGAMAFRYAVRMHRRPYARWFGGTIPIVFHEVLAAAVLLLGSYAARR